MVIVSSKHCDKCNKDFKFGEMKYGKEPIRGGERILLCCPICGEEIPNIIVPKEEAWKYD